MFTLADGTEISPADWWEEETPVGMLDGNAAKLGRLTTGARFVYVFDLGDQWEHLCTVGLARIDPLETLGVVPQTSTAYFGWGSLPDQYGRRFDGDGGESTTPAKPKDLYADLPPLLSMWGGRSRRCRRASGLPPVAPPIAAGVPVCGVAPERMLSPSLLTGVPSAAM